MWIVAPIPKQTKTDRRGEKKKQHVMCHMSSVMCRVAYVTCPVSRVTCHLSLTPTATDPSPANSPIMHSMLVRKDPKTQKHFNTQKNCETTKKQKRQCQY